MVGRCGRVSRRVRTCGDCGGRIGVGARYLAIVLSPGEDAGRPDSWLRFAECAVCAFRYGRGLFLTGRCSR